MELVTSNKENDSAGQTEKRLDRFGIIGLAAAVVTIDALPLLLMGMAFWPFLFLVTVNVGGIVLGALLYKEIITLPQQTYGRFLSADITAKSVSAESQTNDIDKRKAA